MPRTVVQCCPPLAPPVRESKLHVLLDVVPSGAAAPLSSVVIRLANWQLTARSTRASSRVSYTSLPAVSLPRVSLASAFLHEVLALRAAVRESFSTVVKGEFFQFVVDDPARLRGRVAYGPRAQTTHMGSWDSQLEPLWLVTPSSRACSPMSSSALSSFLQPARPVVFWSPCPVARASCPGLPVARSKYTNTSSTALLERSRVHTHLFA